MRTPPPPPLRRAHATAPQRSLVRCTAVDGAVLTLLASSSAAYALQGTAPGRLLSPPMLSFSLALGLSNAGLLPISHPWAYDACTGTLLPVSVCLGLLSTAAAPVEVASGSDAGPLRPMLLAFGIGALGNAVLCTAVLGTMLLH